MNSKYLENLQDINPIEMNDYTKVFLMVFG